MVKKRFPLLAGLFSFLIPGLGQFYCGKTKRAIIIWVASFLLLLLLVNVFAGIHLIYKITPVIVSLIALGCAVDAFIMAMKSQKYTIKRVNKIMIYLGYAFLTVTIYFALFLSSNLHIYRYQTWNVPSGPMRPTIEGQDTIMSDTWIYKFEKPKIGDIVLLWVPEHKQYRVNRIAALDEGEITFNGKGIYNNGAMIVEAGIDYDNVKLYAPEIINRIGSYSLEEGDLFLVGDNFFNSRDSREYGPFPVRYVIAKVIYRINEEDPERDGTYF